MGNPSFLSPHASPIALNGRHLFVANTPSDTVDVIDTDTERIVARLPVGIDPVSIAVRPDGNEVWVANHVSDSVSVIDTQPGSRTHLHVIGTIQHIDLPSRSTRFDEPVGIAFADNRKAYVALSAENQIAIVDVGSRTVVDTLKITAQDPRAIKVRDDRLYVIPFESNNKTQLSGGNEIDGKLVTFDAHAHSIATNNILSIGHVVDIVKHPRVPDRDLYVFDTKTDRLIDVIDSLGTLLYGLTVDSKGQVFIAQTDARNDANGRSGTKKHGLAEMENRAFLNQITRVPATDGEVRQPEFINLEPLPPNHPHPNRALATPFAIEISSDDSLLVATAAGSDKVFTVDAASGKVLGQVAVDAVPRGLALEADINGKPTRAWVLNAVANTVSLVDLTDPSRLKVRARISLSDPTHPTFKRGRMAFNTANASTTKTFSCASCHPDGHTDQLLWVLKTPIVTGGDQIMPRSTMPVRGLRDTEPYHWDGIPGDPYGGINSASIHRPVKPNSKRGVPESATRHLIDGGLAATMAMVGDPAKNDEGKSGLLSKKERDDMAQFLLGVTYPPAQRRAYSNVLSDRAKQGFDLFHIQGNHEGKPRPNVCGDCHRMPFWVSTNTPGSGMDAPTWRGAYDRFLILPQGRLNIIDFDFYRWIAERGTPEEDMWRLSWRGKERFDPVWDMVLEGSTGFSGAFARQLTINSATANDVLTRDLLPALETASSEGGIVLHVDGVFLNEKLVTPVTMQFDPSYKGGRYVESSGSRRSIARGELISMASEGKFVGTFTGRHGVFDDIDHPQPGLWTRGTLHAQYGRQEFPKLGGSRKTMKISGRHVREGAHILVNGKKVPGAIRIEEKDEITIELDKLPAAGMHFLQVQNQNGLFSNDFIFHVVEDGTRVRGNEIATESKEVSAELAEAIAQGNLTRIKQLIGDGASLNQRSFDSGMTPLSIAALYGRLNVAQYLVENGALVTGTNRDGNSPLHVAAFLCRTKVVKYLLDQGASIKQLNLRHETAISVVSSAWSDELAALYRTINGGAHLGLDLNAIRKQRSQIAQILQSYSSKQPKIPVHEDGSLLLR
jgi:YVTN family beta-propeller protein